MATVENKTLDKQSLLAVKTALENKNTYYTTASATANAFTVSIPGVTKLYDGLLVHVKFNAATASGATLNVNGLGAKAIYYRKATAITGHIVANNYVTLIYEASTEHWVMQFNYDANSTTTATKRYLGASYTAGTAVTGGTTQYMHFSAGTTPASSASFTGTKTNSLVTGVSVNSQGSVTLTANTETATGRIQYVESISGSAPSLTGTTTFVTNRGTFTAGSGSLTSNDTASGGLAYITGVTYTKQALGGTTSFNTDAIKTATLTASRSTSGSGASARRTLTLSNTTTAASKASVTITDGAVTPVTKYLHHTHTASSLGAQSTNSVGISGGSYSSTLKYLSASHSGTTLTVTKGDYTPAGSVTLTAGTAPSLTFNTTASGGEAYIKSLSSGSVGGSVSLSENTATATGRIQYVKDIATN